MRKEIICIVCPQGCLMTVDYEITSDGQVEIKSITGNTCPRGVDYAKKELTNPERTITSSVLVENGDLPLVSVRTDSPIPKKMIFDIMGVLKKVKVKAPVKRGQIIVENILGTGANIVATRTVNLKD